jgi:hypothetical protein
VVGGSVVATPGSGIQGGRKTSNFYFLHSRNFKFLIQVNGNYIIDGDFFKGQNMLEAAIVIIHPKCQKT